MLSTPTREQEYTSHSLVGLLSEKQETGISLHQGTCREIRTLAGM